MKIKNKEKKIKPSKSKNLNKKPLGNRTVIGIVCLVMALIICFGIAPMANKTADGKTEIVRVTQTIPSGSMITENCIEVVKVGSYNLPDGIIGTKADVVGKYAKTDLYAGDYFLTSKITDKVEDATDILSSLTTDKKAISVTIGSFAQGISGKLEIGDIISILVYNSKDASVFTPAELQYVMVITSTTAKGLDKPEVKDSTQAVTVTLLVNSIQAELLALYEKTASMHFALEYRGDPATAKGFIDAQDEYLKGA